MTPAIRLSRAVVLLGRFPALAGADLLVERGEVVHVSGPNGAGKTTLLRLCAGLHGLASGQAEVLGVDLTANARDVRRNVGLLGHAGFLYDDLTVAENVRFAVRAAGVPVADGDAALERLGVGGRLRDVPAGRLSAGQRRGTALAVLVARRPLLWLMDEPHAGLDAAGRDLVDGLIADAAAGGATVVFASHELDRQPPAVDRASTRVSASPRRVTVVGGQVRDGVLARA